MTAVDLHDRAYATLGDDVRDRDLVTLALQRQRVATAVFSANRGLWSEAARELRLAADLDATDRERASLLRALADEVEAAVRRVAA